MRGYTSSNGRNYVQRVLHPVGIAFFKVTLDARYTKYPIKALLGLFENRQ